VAAVEQILRTLVLKSLRDTVEDSWVRMAETEVLESLLQSLLPYM
jgi:hypothetical protein